MQFKEDFWSYSKSIYNHRPTLMLKCYCERREKYNLRQPIIAFSKVQCVS